MPEFHMRREPPWKLSLIVLSVFIILFALEGYRNFYEDYEPGMAPGLSMGALYILFAVFLFALILMLFVDKRNSEGVLTIDENGVSYKSRIPNLMKGFSYIRANAFGWQDISRVLITYDTQFARAQDWVILIKKLRLQPNIVIFSGGNSMFLHAKFFSPEDYTRIVSLLEQYSGDKIKREELPAIRA